MLVGLVLGLLFGLMLAEQRVSRANERALLAAGALEAPGDVYRAMAILYPAVFLVMGAEGLWRAATHPVTGGPAWEVSGLLLFAASKGLKYWAIRSLGPRWSFRVLVQPGLPLVSAGPYRYVSHPNYIAVVGEIVGTAMMMRAVVSGPVMLGLFGIALWRRIQVEERALGAASAGSASLDQPSL